MPDVDRRPALITVKVAHTAIWLSIESCMGYLLYTGLVGRTDRRVALAAAVVGGEIVIFAANGFRCPLTQVAENLGAESGSVTDIYLPGWVARNLPAIHVPLVALTATLHAKNVLGKRNTQPDPIESTLGAASSGQLRATTEP